MSSMNNVIRKDNFKIRQDPEPYTIKTYNCRRKTDCPMDNNCLFEYLINKAFVNATTNKFTVVLVKTLS